MRVFPLIVVGMVAGLTAMPVRALDVATENPAALPSIAAFANAWQDALTDPSAISCAGAPCTDPGVLGTAFEVVRTIAKCVQQQLEDFEKCVVEVFSTLCIGFDADLTTEQTISQIMGGRSKVQIYGAGPSWSYNIGGQFNPGHGFGTGHFWINVGCK